MLKAIFFDAGGTLFYTDPSPNEIFARACRELGLFVVEDDLKKNAGRFDEYDRSHHPVKDEKKYLVEYNKWVLSCLEFEVTDEDAALIQNYFDKNLKLVKFPEVDGILSVLKEKKFRLGIISNAIPSQKKRLDALGLDRYFEDFILSGEVGFPKPDKRIFEIALKKFKVKPEEALYVGDNFEKDVVGAREAGMKAVLVDRQKSNDWDCLKIESLGELPGIMDKI